jgi:hypothetical protein
MADMPRLTLLALAAAILPLAAQDAADGPVKMTPEFPLTFPVVKSGAHDVTVKFPVFVNPAVVVTPGMILRVIYMPPAPTDGSEDLALAHHGDMEQAYTRDSVSTDSGPRLSTEIAHAIEGERRHVWEVPMNFVLAMAQYPTDIMHLIYSPKGNDKDLDDEKFGFFDGMFIGLPDGRVTVLAVEDDSRAAQAGIKAQDVITRVGDHPIGADLNAFANAYISVKSNAKDNGAASFDVAVHNATGDHVIPIPTPPTFKTFMPGL